MMPRKDKTILRGSVMNDVYGAHSAVLPHLSDMSIVDTAAKPQRRRDRLMLFTPQARQDSPSMSVRRRRCSE